MGSIFNEEPDEDGYVPLAVASFQIPQQTQYFSRFCDPASESYHNPSPFLGEGLRFKGGRSDYHSMRVHKDDVDEIVRRVREHYRALGHPV